MWVTGMMENQQENELETRVPEAITSIEPQTLNPKNPQLETRKRLTPSTSS